MSFTSPSYPQQLLKRYFVLTLHLNQIRSRGSAERSSQRKKKKSEAEHGSNRDSTEWCNLTSDFIVVEIRDLQKLILEPIQCLFLASKDLKPKARMRIRSKQCDLGYDY